MDSIPIELVPVKESDAEIIFEAWGRHADNFCYLTARVFERVSDAHKYVQDLFPTSESCAFHITQPTSGVVGIVKAAVWGHRAQVGYVVHRPFWGRGFATEAVRRIVDHLEGKPSVTRIWATCALENHGSIRVLEKCGFDREGILKNWVIYPALGGTAFDNYSYVKIPGRLENAR